jgi:hypothetical protein
MRHEDKDDQLPCAPTPLRQRYKGGHPHPYAFVRYQYLPLISRLADADAYPVFPNFKISRWIGFSIFQNLKIGRWGQMRKKRKDVGQKRGNYNSKHGLLGRQFPLSYRTWFGLRETAMRAGDYGIANDAVHRWSCVRCNQRTG